MWASTNLCQEAYCVEHTDEALLQNHLLLPTMVAMLTIYSSISLMFPTSSCAQVEIITYYTKSGIKSVAKQLLVPAIAINLDAKLYHYLCHHSSSALLQHQELIFLFIPLVLPLHHLVQ